MGKGKGKGTPAARLRGIPLWYPWLLGTASGVFKVSCRDLSRVQCVPPPGPCYVRAGPTAVNSCVMYCEGGPAKSSEKEAIAAWNAG